LIPPKRIAKIPVPTNKEISKEIALSATRDFKYAFTT
jgi:hypothetical protein